VIHHNSNDQLFEHLSSTALSSVFLGGIGQMVVAFLQEGLEFPGSFIMGA